MTKLRNKIINDVFVSGLLLLVFYFGLFSLIEYRMQDVFFQNRPLISPGIIVIGIDERTLLELGTPERWSRQIMADTISALSADPDNKPAVIAIDILYVYERDDTDADRALAEAVRNADNVVFAANAVTAYAQDYLSSWRTGNTVVDIERPFKALREHSSYGNVNNLIFDSDNVVRRTDLLINHGDDVIYSFPFEIYRKYATGKGMFSAPEYMHDLYITYHSAPGLYRQASFIDIYNGNFDARFFADEIVLIGAYAPGLHSAYYTPVHNGTMYGVEIQANIVQMLLDGNIKHYLSDLANFALLLVIILLAMFLRYFFNLRATLIIYAAILLLYIGGSLIIFSFGHIPTLAYPIIALSIIVIYQLLYSYAIKTVRVAELQSELMKSENELLQSQVSVMLSQIRPHFLFNSLVTIQELCLIDAQEASDTVAEFSQYLRHNIDSLSDKKPVPFEKELQHVRLYLSIEKKRFGEKLKIINNISTIDFHIPALTLQPIVENAVRHGLTARWEGGTLTIRTEEINGTILIIVHDDGVGFDINAIGGNSIGIKNVQSRLAALCNGSLEIDSKVGSGTTAIIKIPIRMVE